MGKSWCVVEFKDGVQIVPQIWIQGDKCYWPTTFNNSQKLFEKAVKDCKPPDVESWVLHNVRILGVYDSYELAVPKLKLAEIQSDLNTDEETTKKSRSFRKRIIHSTDEDKSESSDEEIAGIAAFPKLPKKISCLSGAGEEFQNYNKKQLASVSKACSSSSIETVISSNTVTEPVLDCCRCCCMFDKDYKRKTERDFKEVKNQLQLVLQILRDQNRPATITDEAFNEDIEEQLPMKSQEEVGTWERHLSNKDEQKKMVSFLARIGGHEVNTVVKNMLKKLFADCVGSLYNWEGKKGKKMFSSLIISNCIKKAASLSPNVKGTTEQEIINSVKNWLRHASARLNNSQKKHQEDPAGGSHQDPTE